MTSSITVLYKFSGIRINWIELNWIEYGGIVLEEALDLSSDRILNEWMRIVEFLW